MAEADDKAGSMGGLARAFGKMLGVHIQYAQREAKSDVGRLVGGALLLLMAAGLVMLAAFFGHVALAYYLAASTELDMMGAVGVVAGGDLALAIVLMLVGRGRLKKPVLEQTRSLVKQTVDAFADV